MKKIIFKSVAEIDPKSQNGESRRAFELLKQGLKRKESVSSLLPLLLAACGGGGSGPGPSQPVAPTPDFTESPTNTFTARDNNNRTLSQSAATANLIVIGKDGNDTITTGSGDDVIDGGAGNDTISSGDGADMIRGGAGADTVSAGAGDDIIVLIGITTANQYLESAITNPAGIGADLSALLALADLNGHTVSDVVIGESLDGGAGNNTLVIYGDVDISGITLSNLTTIWINSTLTLTTAQLNAFTALMGDGASALNIVSNAGSGIFEQVDLSAIDLSGIGLITSNGNVELLVSNASQLAGIAELVTSQHLIVTIAAGVTINASDFASLPVGLTHLNIQDGATLVLDTVEGVALLGDMQLTGNGTVSVAGGLTGLGDSLTSIQIDDDVTFVDFSGLLLDITTMGGVYQPDIDPGDGVFPVLTIGSDVTVHEADQTASFTMTLDYSYFEDITVFYSVTGSRFPGGSVTFTAGEVSQTITFTWQDNVDYNPTEIVYIHFNAIADILPSTISRLITILDEEAVEPDGSPDYGGENSYNPYGEIAIGETLIGQITHEADDDRIHFNTTADTVYHLEIIGADGGGGTMVTPDTIRIHNGSYEEYNNIYTAGTGGSVYFEAGDRGSYYAFVDGTPGTYTFRLTEVDTREPDGLADIGNDASGATPLALDTPLVQGLAYHGDTDVYAVTLEAGTVYQLTVAGAASGGGTLSDPALDQLQDFGGLNSLDISTNGQANTDIQLSFEVASSGTYYLPVTSASSSGSYTISLTTVTVTEPGGAVDIGSTTNGAFSLADGLAVEAELTHVGDVDMFELTAQAGDVWDISLLTASDGVHTLENLASVSVYNSSGQVVDLIESDYGEFIIPADGSYYFSIESSRVGILGTYQVLASLVDTSEPDASPDFTNDTSTTSVLAAGNIVDGTLSYSSDLDWHQMTLTAGEVYQVTYTVSSPNMADMYFEGVYGETGAYVNNFMQGSSVLGLDRTIFISPETSGSYFVGVGTASSERGDYTLVLTQIDTSEPGGSADYGDTVGAAYSYDMATILSGTIAYELDNDFLAVELTVGQSYTFTMSGDATYGNALAVGDIYQIHDIYGYSYYGTEGTNISTDGTDTFTFTAHYTGTFYLELNNGNSTESGDYTLNVARVGLDEPGGATDISAGLDTTASITVGTSVIGGAGLEYDRDWYAVEFVAGNVYQLTLTGDASGTGTLVDPRIHLIYDSNGVGIAGAFNDDGYGASRESFMLFTAPYTGTYYIAAGGWEYEVGTYELTVSDVTSTHTGDLPYGPTNAETLPNIDYIDISGDFRIDGLISGLRYSIDPDGTTTTITYSLPDVNNFYSTRFYGDVSIDSEPWVGFEPLTSGQRAAFQDFIVYLEAHINIDLVQVSDSYGSAGTIRIAWTDLPPDNSAAWAYLPDGSPYSGDIWLSVDNVAVSNKQPGNYLYYLYLHETGHALGLKHTFETDGYFPALPLAYDSHQWSVMAYNFNTSFADAYAADLYPQTYMYFDILALQYLYGTLPTNIGDDTYVFDGNERYYLTMWDNGGIDTIEFINQSAGVHIDLGGGQWQDVGTTIHYDTDHGPETEDYTVFIPEEVVIENVYGTAYGDTLSANGVDNNLLGGGGDDVISGLGGNDTIDGGQGQDTLIGGTEADIFVTRSGDGGALITDADIVLDFADGEDLIGLNGLSFADLTIEAGSGDHAGDTIISVTSSGEYLVILDGIDVSLITIDDFAPVADDWWLA